MKVAYISKKRILFQCVVLAACVAFGWELKTRLTPREDAAFEREIPYVVTAKAQMRTFAPHKKYIATVETINGVDVKSQAAGYLDKVLFEEGAFVKKGQLLFVIEQGRFKEAVNLAQADLARAQANLKEIENDHKRNLVLYRQKVLTASNIEASESALAQAKAAVKAAEANAETAKINLGYTEIKSAIDGVIGKALATKGNYIDMSGQPMARIVQLSPIRISFSVTDRDRLAAIKHSETTGDFIKNVKVVLPDLSEIPVKVIHTFFDSEVNLSTATVAAYVDVENKNSLLLPGNHVDVLVQTDAEKPRLIVPQVALAQDAAGSFVYVVDADGKAVKTYVKTGETLDDGVAVEEGLNDGDDVIVQGLQKVENGSAVKQSAVR